MDIETEAPVDDLEALFVDEEDAWRGDAGPTAACTIEAQTCTTS